MEIKFIGARIKEICHKIKKRGVSWGIKRMLANMGRWLKESTQSVFSFIADARRNGFRCAYANRSVERRFHSLIKESYYYSTLRIPAPYPVHAHIEVTSLCNLTCSMCPRANLQREQGAMSFDVFRKIIDKLALARLPNTLFLHFTGEPLLNDDLPMMIRYAKDKGVPWIKFNTNAVFLDEKKSMQIIDSGLDCLVCALEMNKEQEALLRPGADYAAVASNIEKFMKLKKKSKATKPLVKLQMLVTKENQGFKTQAYNRWKNTVDRVEFHPLHTVGGLVDDLGATNLKRSHCEQVWVSLIFLWNGDVVPCCFNHDASLRLGNILTDSFEAIWHNDFINKLREQDRVGVYSNPVCRRCMVQGASY
ncbi:MAG: hypothetical protein A2Y00_03080 [Omnitrophica WOR_2 bacterium GWF2_43_52]|nr:MAG: hypothetical protein A2Y00_03080 [Omnitrophica WOR_2 bacterium GWF2_43_52]OGX55396.1 MAG: hypothetical protein A2460_07490 [Omnitrophica WOR_2 bacterium RIFOXYC2_FULL_43_9]HAH20836.1 hypothetical protein [Candidatus Omnitrophota bacterium]HBG64504.1 hypothetical protein [Candidatus Omnitrophota bacterium]HCD38473.1 hypothetical protein [Candidatus Omnitrophota bacterium]